MLALKAALAAVAAFGKFGWLLKFAPFLGPVPAIAMAVLGFIGKFFYWLCADIADAFKEPWRFVVRTVCILAVLAFGIYEGHRIAAPQIAAARAETKEWKDANKKLMDDARKADAENKQKLADALKAKAAAEEAAGKATPAATPPAQPERVRVRARKASAGANSGGGTGLQWLFGVSAGKSK